MLMLDVFSGLGGASEAMKQRGWKVIRVDIEPAFSPDIVADVATWQWHGGPVDLLWLSPPCTEFARESMPWCRTGQAPDTRLFRRAFDLARQIPNRYYVIENVRGAIRYAPYRYTYRIGPFFLWSNLPPLPRLAVASKERLSSAQAAERAKVPYALSEAIAILVEQQGQLFAA